MEDHTRSLSPNTVAFACLDFQVAILTPDIINALASVLRWRQVSKFLLTDILMRLAELPSFELTHAEFSEAIWPSLGDSARKEKFSKWIRKLMEDMALSNFSAVKIQTKRPDRNGRGEWRNLPTLYLIDKFLQLYRAVQDVALECDLFSFDVRPRRAKLRKIVKQWLADSGAVAIERQQSQKKTKKFATESEATGAAQSQIDQLRRQPNEDFNVDLEWFSERYYRYLCELREAGSEFRFMVKRVLHAMEISEQRAQEIIINENNRENTRQFIKLIGGQPK